MKKLIKLGTILFTFTLSFLAYIPSTLPSDTTISVYSFLPPGDSDGM